VDNPTEPPLEVSCGRENVHVAARYYESPALATVLSDVFVVGCGTDHVCFRESLYLEERTLQMRIKMLFLAMCLSISAIAAAPQFTIWGSTDYERNRLTRLEQSLNFSKVPMTNTWNVTIIPGEDFRRRVELLKVETDSAYTILQFRQTFMNEDYLVYADDGRVRHTLAHESGHLICECNSETKANEIAYQLEFGK